MYEYTTRRFRQQSAHSFSSLVGKSWMTNSSSSISIARSLSVPSNHQAIYANASIPRYSKRGTADVLSTRQNNFWTGITRDNYNVTVSLASGFQLLSTISQPSWWLHADISFGRQSTSLSGALVQSNSLSLLRIKSSHTYFSPCPYSCPLGAHPPRPGSSTQRAHTRSPSPRQHLSGTNDAVEAVEYVALARPEALG